MRFAAVLLIALLAGCSSFQPKWTKEGATSKDFQVADKQCEDEAVERANAIATHIVYPFYTGCMKAAGWTPPPAPKEDEGHEEPKVAKMDAFKAEREKNAAKHDTAGHDAPKHDAPAAETPKHDAPAEAPKH